MLVILVPLGAQATAPQPGTVQDLELQLGAVRAYIARTDAARRYIALSSVDMRAVINDGTNWLITSQEPSGHFTYEYAPFEGEYLHGDNIVRQVGALFALGEVYRLKKEYDPALAKSITQAIAYFTSLEVSGKEAGVTFVCIGTTAKKRDCKLGAAALALIGLLDYVEQNPRADKTYAPLIQGYTSFILAAQKESGGFRDLYRVEDGFVNRESPYSNGEALLALVRAYQYKKDEEVKHAIDSAFTYLKTTEYVNPLYLWIMAALKDMNRLWPSSDYVTYARDFTTWRIRNAGYPKSTHNYCPYVEGLVSAYSVLAANPEKGELESLRAHIDPWHAYHRTLQLAATEPYRVMANSKGTPIIQKIADTALATGGFLTGPNVPTQRIDFTQHCVSAYLQTLVDIDGEVLR
ncbi:MAG: hypothetical protein RLZZ234_428 [Candidatus Parcubacteria bacterium]